MEVRHVCFWHICDMPVDAENVCLSGWTGSGRRIVKMTRLTQSGHWTQFFVLSQFEFAASRCQRFVSFHDTAPGAPKSKIQFNGVGGLLTYISFTQGADDMSDHDKWISYSHWGMFLTGTKYSK
jgi:hypothetical protein